MESDWSIFFLLVLDQLASNFDSDFFFLLIKTCLHHSELDIGEILSFEGLVVEPAMKTYRV